MAAPQEVILGLTEGLVPVATETAMWPGACGWTVAAYAGVRELPDELVVSVRCLVTIGGSVLAFEAASGSVDILPGGRREAGESWSQTAQREVMEETGWHVDEDALTMLGFIHLRHLTPVPAGLASLIPTSCRS